jgi:signal transduction histidine kinase
MRTERVHTCFRGFAPRGGLVVTDHWDDEELDVPRRRRRRRHRHRRRAEPPPSLEEPEDLLSAEERAWRRAERRADAKTRLVSEDLWVLGICVLLLVVFFPVGVVVTIVWGRQPLKRAYRLFVEPKLRHRFIEQEVQSQVAETLSHERQVLEGEHARSMQNLSASIAHEIRNPITAAKSLVQQMEEDPTRAENVEYARVALEELMRVERSVSHLLRFARDEEMGLAEVRMADVVDSALETFRDRCERSGIALERRVDSEGWMRGDAEKLRRVVINLVGNAIDALAEGGAKDPRIEVAMGENLAGTEVWVRVKDNGPGIDAEAQRKLFSPFYTSKAGGTGLGLAICRKLVDAHGGSVEVTSAPGHGAEFLLTFPKTRGAREVER